MRIRILVIDDEDSICEILKYNLQKEGFDVDTANSAEEALEMDLTGYSLMIVDIMMERLSGFDFAKRVQNNPATEKIPIIFCSALNGEDDTVMGLNIGADDYITKPFAIPEVIARVRAVLRRTQNRQQHPVFTPKTQTFDPDVTFRGLRIDRNEKMCYINGEPLNLTPTEYGLIYFYLTHRNRIYSREEIIRNVWGVEVSNRTVDTNMARLRKKLGEYGNHIHTRTGFGYGFKEED